MSSQQPSSSSQLSPLRSLTNSRSLKHTSGSLHTFLSGSVSGKPAHVRGGSPSSLSLSSSQAQKAISKRTKYAAEVQKTIDALKKAASKQARELETTRKLIQDANVSRKDAETQLAMKVNELETTKEQANVLAEVMRRCNAQNDQLRAKLAQLDNNHGELELSRKEARMLREKLGDVVKQYEQQRAGAQRVQKLAFEKIQNEQATKENMQGQLDAKDTEIETAKAGAQ